MRSGEEGPGLGNALFLPHTLCLSADSPAPHSTCLPPKPFPRYGGFSLGGRDPDLPSGHEVVRAVAEMRALLNPQPGNVLDRILNNLTQWALGLDTRNSLKVGAGAGKRGWLRTPNPRSHASLNLMALALPRSGSTTRAGMPWWPL